jgi:flagellar operon protein
MTDPIRVTSTPPVQSTSAQNAYTQAAQSTSETSFADTLNQVQNLRFSNHAQKRMEYRDINLTEDGMNRLANAVDKADKRGGKESLVLVDDMAFIVNVKDRLVVTALDSQSRGEGVFTKIDSVVFADPSNGDSSTTSSLVNKTA